MKLQHLRRHTESPSLGGIWFVHFRPGGHSGGFWDEGEAKRSAPAETKGSGRRGVMPFKLLGMRPAMAGGVGAMGLVILTAVLLVP